MNFYVIYRTPNRKGDCYSRVEAKNWADARREIMEETGGWFYMMLTEKEFLPYLEKWELIEIELTRDFCHGEGYV